MRKTVYPSKKTVSPRKRKQKEVTKEAADEIKCEICSRGHSKPPNQIILCDNCDFAVHQECYKVLEIPEGDWLCRSCDQEDVVKSLNGPVGKTSEEGGEAVVSAVAVPAESPDIANFEQHLRTLQRVLLDRCTGRRRIQMFGQEEVYEKARQLVEQTIVSCEGNSMLLIGARGCGKTTVSEQSCEIYCVGPDIEKKLIL